MDLDLAIVLRGNAALLRGERLCFWGAGSSADGNRWCGNGIDYCAAPDCQFLYGPACDANTVPAGASTAGIARPQLGSIPYGGAGIYDCLVPGGQLFPRWKNILLTSVLLDIAFTFDDGPYNYTSDLLDKLAVYNASATFMISKFAVSPLWAFTDRAKAGNNLGKGRYAVSFCWSLYSRHLRSDR